MNFFKRLFGRKTYQQNTTSKKTISKDLSPESETLLLPNWADDSMTEEEEERVAIIVAACLANSLPNKKYRIKRVLKVDEDWVVAGLAAISGVSQGGNHERYRIKSIKRVK